GPVPGRLALDVVWIKRDGSPMTDEDWQIGGQLVLGKLIHGRATDEIDERGRPMHGETVLLMVNGGAGPVRFKLPALDEPGVWEELINTARQHVRTVVSADAVNLAAHALMLLIHKRP
ncbi:MAG: hypothetical protein AAF658_16890, partial [Myxococcota bacterium]